MALAPASPSSGILAKRVESTPSPFLSLPRDIQVAILKRVEEAAEAAKGAKGGQADGSGGDSNSLLPLRLVSRAFQAAVDRSMTKFTCHIKFINKRDCHLLALLDSCFQHVLLRWPGIHDLSIHFVRKAAHLEYLLAAAARSCRELRTLSLSAAYLKSDRPIKESGVSRFEAIRQWTTLESLSIDGPVCSDCFKGLSVLSSLPRLEGLVLVRTGLRALEALPALTSLKIVGEAPGRPQSGIHDVDLSKLPLSTKLVRLTLEAMHVDSLVLPSSLTELEIEWVAAEDKFRHQASLPNLTSLYLRWIDCHETVPGLSTSSRLQPLNLSDMRHKQDLSQSFRLPPVDRMEHLRTLRLFSLHVIEVIPGLTSLLSLQELYVSNCLNLEIPMDVSWQLTTLSTLKLESIKSLSGPPPPPGSVVWLRQLELGVMSKVQRLELSPFQALTSLKVFRMRNLVCLEGLEKMTALRHLDIQYCPHVKTADLVMSLPDLTSLTVDGIVVEKQWHCRPML